jgi:hypothetical protein
MFETPIKLIKPKNFLLCAVAGLRSSPSLAAALYNREEGALKPLAREVGAHSA